LERFLGGAVEDCPISKPERERVRAQNRVDLLVPGSIGPDAFGLVVMPAVDLHEYEPLSQDEEIDPAAFALVLHKLGE